MKRPLIIDCDPGVDDAVALLLALSAGDELEILGVTTVAGNVGAALTARNACVIRELAEREDVPVFAGAEHALMGGVVAADHFHGASGLGDWKFNEPRKTLAEGRSAQFIVETLRRAPPQFVTIGVTGPMTNLALALLWDPAIRAGIREIVVMGGARSAGGNITASAEYNIYADPHAASIVLSSGLPIVAIGLDATHQVRTTPERMQRLRDLATGKSLAAAELLRFGEEVERKHAGCEGAPLHDPCIIAYLLRPDLFEVAPCAIKVETASPLTLGHTAVEFCSAAASTTDWATGVDADGVFELLTERLA